jgi:hypothetical protein
MVGPRDPADHPGVVGTLFSHHNLGQHLQRLTWAHASESKIRVDLQRRYCSGTPGFMVSSEFFNVPKGQRRGGNSAHTLASTHGHALLRCLKSAKPSIEPIFLPVEIAKTTSVVAASIPVNSFANWLGSTRAIECDRSFVACDNVKACFGNAAFVQGCKEGRQQGFTYALR